MQREKTVPLQLAHEKCTYKLFGIRLNPLRLFVFSCKIYIHLTFHIGNNSIIYALFAVDCFKNIPIMKYSYCCSPKCRKRQHIVCGAERTVTRWCTADCLKRIRLAARSGGNKRNCKTGAKEVAVSVLCLSSNGRTNF